MSSFPLTFIFFKMVKTTSQRGFDRFDMGKLGMILSFDGL
jgi:hypothetical protein